MGFHEVLWGFRRPPGGPDRRAPDPTFAGNGASPAAPEAGGDGAAPATSLLVDMAVAMKLAEEPIVYPVEPIAARGFLTVLAGRHSSYKSWLLLAVCAAAHRGGGELAGLRCEPTTALYVDAENGPRLMGRRFAAAGIPADGLLVADGMQLRLPHDTLRALIEETGAGLVVLDSLRRLAPRIRENESDDTASLMAALATITRDLDVAIVLVHHRSTKPGAPTLRGSSAIEDQADLVFGLERVLGDPDPERRRLKVEKFRIDADPAPIWLRMGVVAGMFTIAAAEPWEGGRGDGDEDDQRAAEGLAERIRTLADQVTADGGWAPSRLAAAVGSDRGSGTFQRAVKLLLDADEWRAEGQGKARRLQPCQPCQPLREGAVGAVQEQLIGDAKETE